MIAIKNESVNIYGILIFLSPISLYTKSAIKCIKDTFHS